MWRVWQILLYFSYFNTFTYRMLLFWSHRRNAVYFLSNHSSGFFLHIDSVPMFRYILYVQNINMYIMRISCFVPNFFSYEVIILKSFGHECYLFYLNVCFVCSISCCKKLNLEEVTVFCFSYVWVGGKYSIFKSCLSNKYFVVISSLDGKNEPIRLFPNFVK